MDEAFINGYISTITSKFGERELQIIRDSLHAYSLSWDIKPLPTAVAVADA